MQVNLDDVAFWMDAVRNSENSYGVLESFWKGQLKSKVWLIENLKHCVQKNKSQNIVIHGGWNGVLASLLFNSNIDVEHITNVDIDVETKGPASDICKRQEMEGRFIHVVQDMEHFTYANVPDIVINTSTEHITAEKYKNWLSQVPNESLIVLQNNNYYELPEHINCFNNVEDFAVHSGLGNILKKDSLELPLYDRFLLIGYK